MKPYLTTLRNADIFYKFTEYQLNQVANLFQEKIFNTGEMIFLEGSKSEEHPDLGYQLMLNLAVDLALKIRSTGMLIREELLYRSAQK